MGVGVSSCVLVGQHTGAGSVPEGGPVREKGLRCLGESEQVSDLRE